MFFARYENTMKNARPKFVEPEVVRTMAQIRAEKRAEALRLQRERAAELERRRAEEAERWLTLQAVAMYRTIEIRDCKTPVRSLIERVGAFHDVRYEDIVGPRRDRKTTAARFDAIAAVHKARPDLSTPQIGRAFNRDHTAILFALGRLKKKPRVRLT